MGEVTFEEYLERKFREFIAAVYREDVAGEPRSPYLWQIRMMKAIVENGRWPDRIVAPTASGKTCVIDIHVFLNAMAGLQFAGRLPANMPGEHVLRGLPRRLALTVNRRSLVDDQYDQALELQKRVLSAHPGDALHEWRLGLEYRANVGCDEDLSKADDGQAALNTLIVVELRGGLGATANQREWRYHPQTCAVICATPDMFGSRLLFRGYGTSRAMRPMEAGELAYDTVLVADEAHLSRQLLETARQIPRIESYAGNAVRSCVSPLQVVETTATPAKNDETDSGTISVGVEESDFTTDRALAKRLQTPKTLTITRSAVKDKERIEQIVDCCMRLIEKRMNDGTTSDDSAQRADVIGCVLNTVPAAQQVYDRLCAQLKKRLKQSDVTQLIRGYVGPMRPYEKQREVSRLHKIFAEKPTEETPYCIVGTQTLEVGVDADFSDMVTELAPAAALVQRAGRVNRRGLRADSHIYAFGMSEQLSERERQKSAIPYSVGELEEAAAWIESLPQTDGGHEFSAWAIHEIVAKGSPVPAERPGRLLYQRLEQWDVENLSHTDEDLFSDCAIPGLQQAPSDVNLWLRDNLDWQDDMSSIGVVVRDLPWDDELAASLIELAPPLDDEVFPLGRRAQVVGARDSLRTYLLKESPIVVKRSVEGSSYGELHKRRVFRYRPSMPMGRRVAVYDHERGLQSASDLLAPGDIFVVDSYAPLFNGLPTFAPSSGQKVEPVLRQCSNEIIVVSADKLADDRRYQALEAVANQVECIREQREWQGQQSDTKLHELQSALPVLIGELLSCIGRNDVAGQDITLVDWIHDVGDSECESSEQRAGQSVSYSFRRHHDDWWMVLRVDASLTGDDISQEVSHAGKVLLQGEDGHQCHVAERTKSIARSVGLVGGLVESLYLAGLYHDEGKKDVRFQALLRKGRGNGESGYLAKSAYRSWVFERQFREAHQLTGWRHEQRSVTEFLVAMDRENPESGTERDGLDTELVARLIGTSHGHGRSTFNHASDFLLPQGEEQFDPALVSHAKDLFDRGGWESLIDRTNARYGFWAAAYLESLLRAADITVSKEGR